MLAFDFSLSVVLTTGIVAVLFLVLGYRLLNRDSSVKRTRWGFFVERDHYDDKAEGETWTVDPLPPPTPPPPIPPGDETQTWPQRKEES